MPIQLVLRPSPGGQHNHHSIVTTQADLCLDSELLSDLRIECPDGTILSHQSLLAPLSPLLSSVMGSYLPFPGLIHTIMMPIKMETMKSILKIIYTGKIALSSQVSVDKVLSGLKLLGIHLPGLECFRAAGYSVHKAGQNSVSRVSNTNIPLPFSNPNHSRASNLCTNIVQLPSIPVMEDVKPTLLPLPPSEDQPPSLDNLRIVLARQLLPLGIGESAECNVEGCSVLVTLSTLAQHFKDHKEKELHAFKCIECDRGFKDEKNLEIHRIRDHAQQKRMEKRLIYSEDAEICENNNVKTSESGGCSSILTRNKKITNARKGIAADSQAVPVPEFPSLVCALCQASLQSEWYRPPSRHNCPHSTPQSSRSQVHCNQCSTPLSSTWYLPPSRHGCTAVSTSTAGQGGSSTSARKKPRLSAVESRGESIEEVEHSCGKCSNKFSSVVELRSHYTVSHYWDIIATKFSRWGPRCYICMRAFQSSDLLVRHMGNFHSFVDQCLLKDGLSLSIDEKPIALKTFECGFCGEVKSTSTELKSHLCYVHFGKELEREFPAKGSGKTCGICGKLLSTNQARMKHIGYFHDQVLKYAKKFISVTVNDAQLIAENGFDVEGEPFDEEDSYQYLADWGHTPVSKISSTPVSKISSPQISDKCIPMDETVSESVFQNRSQELYPSEQQQQPLQKCPLTYCFRECTNKAEILVHLAMTHYLDELHKEFGADFGLSQCKVCEKSLPTSKEGFLKHMAVDHEAVMTYVERDMALEAELNKAVDDLEVTEQD